MQIDATASLQREVESATNNFIDGNSDQGLSPSLFQSLMRDRLFSMDYEIIAEAERKITWFSGIRLGAVDICRHDGFGLHRSTRRQIHIRSDKVDDYLLHLPLIGRSQITQNGVTASVEPGHFVIMSTTSPVEGVIRAASSSDLFSCYQARISASELRARIPLIEDYCDQSIPIRQGSGKMMLPLFDLALKDGGYLPEAQTRQLGMMLIEIVANSIVETQEREAGHGRSAPATALRILGKARGFIETNLSNPDLNIGLIADHCHVSVRSLQSAFAASALKLTAVILERRLLRCRSALQNPVLEEKTVTQIAMAWGFNSPAYFSQVYKQRFGTSPSADREAGASDLECCD